MIIKLYEDFVNGNIDKDILTNEINDLLVDLYDLGFEWYFSSRDYNNSFVDYIDISIMPIGGVEYNIEFKIDESIMYCVNTLVDWMKEKYGINDSNFSYKLSLVTLTDIICKEFEEEELGLMVYEIIIMIGL
jgi:hypothetical protein